MTNNPYHHAKCTKEQKEAVKRLVLTTDKVKWVLRPSERKIYINLSSIPGRQVGVAAIHQLNNGKWVYILVIAGKRYPCHEPMTECEARQRLIDIINMESI
jgi:hypothetical protein